MKATLIVLAVLGGLLWVFAPNAHMRGVPALPDFAPPPPTPATTAPQGLWFADDIDTTQAAAYRERLAEACGHLDPNSLDYSYCEDEYARYESGAWDRDDVRDEDDSDWLEGQQAHQDALEMGR
jgi:hypothetical protein